MPLSSYPLSRDINPFNFISLQHKSLQLFAANIPAMLQKCHVAAILP